MFLLHQPVNQLQRSKTLAKKHEEHTSGSEREKPAKTRFILIRGAAASISPTTGVRHSRTFRMSAQVSRLASTRCRTSRDPSSRTLTTLKRRSLTVLESATVGGSAKGAIRLFGTQMHPMARPAEVPDHSLSVRAITRSAATQYAL